MKLVSAFVAMMFLCLAPSASAVPVLVDASPSAGSTITAVPGYVRLTFDRPIGGAGPYSVTVTRGDEVWSEPMLGADETVLTVPLRPAMPAGDYLVRYEVTPPSGVAVSGQYRFALGAAPGAGTAPWVWLLAGVASVVALATAYRLVRR